MMVPINPTTNYHDDNSFFHYNMTLHDSMTNSTCTLDQTCKPPVDLAAIQQVLLNSYLVHKKLCVWAESLLDMSSPITPFIIHTINDTMMSPKLVAGAINPQRMLWPSR